MKLFLICFLSLLVISAFAEPGEIGTVESFQPGISGSFYDPNQDGQGIQLEYLSDFQGNGDTLVLYLYSYSELDQVPTWIICVGNVETKRANEVNKNAAELDCFYTAGGMFLEQSNVHTISWGKAIIEAHSCSRLKVEYVSNSGQPTVSPMPPPREVGILSNFYDQELVRLTPMQRPCVEQCSSPDFGPSRCKIDNVE